MCTFLTTDVQQGNRAMCAGLRLGAIFPVVRRLSRTSRTYTFLTTDVQRGKSCHVCRLEIGFRSINLSIVYLSYILESTIVKPGLHRKIVKYYMLKTGQNRQRSRNRE